VKTAIRFIRNFPFDFKNNTSLYPSRPAGSRKASTLWCSVFRTSWLEKQASFLSCACRADTTGNTPRSWSPTAFVAGDPYNCWESFKTAWLGNQADFLYSAHSAYTTQSIGNCYGVIPFLIQTEPIIGLRPKGLPTRGPLSTLANPSHRLTRMRVWNYRV